ncbi:MAG TPA: LysE family translocator [Anaerolineae bacterium]|nr:LysE family translocator [Anaerolineae bacterium]
MFDYTSLHWITFLSAAVLLNLSPGPDMAFILGQAAGNGRRAGFAAMLGIWSGTFLHVILAAVGLSAILAASDAAFALVKWAGAAYLVWLGLHALFSRGSPLTRNAAADTLPQKPRAWAIYRQGALVSALNPKVAIFFLAFLPQFVVPGAGPVGAQMFLHGSLIIVVAALIEPLLVFTGSRLTESLQNNRRAGLWLDRGLGVLLITLGVHLAVS